MGREIALELARQGANLVLLARREEKLREVADEIGRLGGGGKVEVVVGDVTDPDSRRAMLERVQSTFGGLDILVNNAGVGTLARFETSDPQVTRKVFDINFFAPVDLTREALPLLKAGRKPIVVNIGSVVGHRGMPQNSDYCASKFALRGWSESLRVELKPMGIDVLLVSPGSTVTEFWDNLAAKAVRGTVVAEGRIAGGCDSPGGGASDCKREAGNYSGLAAAHFREFSAVVSAIYGSHSKSIRLMLRSA